MALLAPDGGCGADVLVFLACLPVYGADFLGGCRHGWGLRPAGASEPTASPLGRPPPPDDHRLPLPGPVGHGCDGGVDSLRISGRGGSGLRLCGGPGGGVHGTEPSRSLTERLEAALDYLRTYPEAQCIVTGGQGGGENIHGGAVHVYLADGPGNRAGAHLDRSPGPSPPGRICNFLWR